MAVIGFNIGSTISLGDMDLALDYLADKEAFETDLQDIKKKIYGKEVEQSKIKIAEAGQENQNKAENINDLGVGLEDLRSGEEMAGTEELDDDFEVDLAELEGYEDTEDTEDNDIISQTPIKNELQLEDNEDEDFEIDISELEGYEDAEDEEDTEIKDTGKQTPIKNELQIEDEDDEFEIDLSELGGYEDTEDKEDEEDTEIKDTGKQTPIKNELQIEDNEYDYSGADDSSNDSDDDDFEIDMDDLGGYEDTEVYTEVCTVKEKIAVVKQIHIKTGVDAVETINQQDNQAESNCELINKENELKIRLNNINRHREDGKRNKLKLLEEQVLAAEREIEVEQTEKETLAKQQNKIKANNSRTLSTANNQQVVQKQSEDRKIDQSAVKASKTDKYSQLDTEALYSEVRNFMQINGVAKSIVDKRILEEEFGAQNIKKLILKSYLISIGKGVTIGR